MENDIRNNKHWEFWLTFWSIINFVTIFLFMLFMGVKEQITFKKEYCLLLLPLLMYNIIQLVINYCNLTDNEYEN